MSFYSLLFLSYKFRHFSRYRFEHSPSVRQILKFCFSPDSLVVRGKMVKVKLDKERNLIKLDPLSFILSKYLQQKITPLVNGKLSSSVHSYVHKKNQMTALKSFQAYLRKYRKKTAVGDRNLFVFRGDIKKCGENIPVHQKSLLWNFFVEANVSHLNLVKKLLRPEIEGRGTYSGLYGTPTGSPLQPLCINAYLSFLDQQFLTSEDGCYLRFGDDFLFCHHDFEKFELTLKRVTQKINELELEWKQEDIFQLNAPAKKIVELPAKSSVEFLGLAVHFNGGIRLNREKEKILFRDFRKLAKRIRFFRLRQSPVDLKKVVCSFFQLKSDSAHDYLRLAAVHVDDRSWRRDVSQKMMLTLASKITGIEGRRAFRFFSPQKLKELGLVFTQK